MAPQTKPSKMMNYINYRMRIHLADKRSMVGIFLAFDKHMNVVLGETEEFRQRRRKGGNSGSGGIKRDINGNIIDNNENSNIAEEVEDKRVLGLVLVRGENIVSLTVEGPPPVDADISAEQRRSQIKGPGTAKAVGRGAPINVPYTNTSMSGMNMNAPLGLGAPVRGIGGVNPSAMQPVAPLGPGMMGRGK